MKEYGYYNKNLEAIKCNSSTLKYATGNGGPDGLHRFSCREQLEKLDKI